MEFLYLQKMCNEIFPGHLQWLLYQLVYIIQLFQNNSRLFKSFEGIALQK
jgi:hypothetical protein